MRWTRELGAALLVAASLGVVFARCALSPSFPVLFHGSAQWIGAPRPVSAALQQWGRAEAPLHRFERDVVVTASPGSGAILEIRAFGAFEARFRGEVVARGDAPGSGVDWRVRKSARLPAADAVDGVPERLVVDVRNARGPALLWAHANGARGAETADDGSPGLVTDGSWRVSVAGGPARSATVADDTRHNPLSYASPSPGAAWRAESGALLAWLCAGGLVFALRVRSEARGVDGSRRAPLGALALAAGAWGLFGSSFLEVPEGAGFDVRHHLAYVSYLLERGRLPLATEGWSMFHPPLFYASAALWFRGLGLAVAEAPVWALRALPFAAGLATLGLVFALARRLLPARPGTQALAIGFAALLPMHVYLSANFSGESFHTFLATLGILQTVSLLLAERRSAPAVAGLAAILALAVLTKHTALVLVPIALGFLVARTVRSGGADARGGAGASPTAAAAKLASVFVLTMGVLAGWYYARNWMALGVPVATNWNLPGETQSWWQWPGFRTPAYYAGFGEALWHPLLGGFHSFADSLYSTLWGDGYIAGRVSPLDRHGAWNYEAMVVGYWLALPATALLVAGVVGIARSALRDPDPGRRAAFGFLGTTMWALALAFVYMSLQVPFYSQIKASYGLMLIGPLAIGWARAAASCDDWLAAHPGAGSRLLRGIAHGWLACLFGTFLRAFAG